MNIILDTKPISNVGSTKVTHFTAVYDPRRNVLNIVTAGISYVKILSDEELRSPDLNWRGQAFDKHDLCSINEVFNNYGTTEIHDFPTPYTSGHLDFSNYNHIYMSSSMGYY